MSSDIYPYEREGAWTSSHGYYYQCAYKALYDYVSLLKILEKKEKEIENTHQGGDYEILSSIIWHETDELREDCYRAAISAHLFACMTIEAFLNHYGVKRLGEAFYKRNIEKVGITEKLSMLVLACCQKQIELDSELIKKTRVLFDTRNRLVHPKTREINSENMQQYVNEHPRDLLINSYIDNMEFVIGELCKLDKDIKRKIEFIQPNKCMKPTT